MENLTPIFIALTGAAVLLQAGLLAAMYLTMRKTSARLEALSEDVKTKAFPVVENIQATLTELRPKLEVIARNVEETTTVVRAQVGRVEATVNDAVDRARLQIIRGDELLTRTMDRVESTSEIVSRTVTSPVRKVSGIIQGVTAGVEFFLGSRGKNGHTREAGRAVPQDEMFI